MNETTRQRVILVPIDLHGIEPGALELLAGIARQLDRGLLGLFLEDVRLQQVADLPFTTEIILSSGRERGLLRRELVHRHSKVAEETRRRLNELARRHRIELSFEDAAGTRWHSALERDGHLDIFFPPRRRWRDKPVAAASGAAIRRLGVLLGGGEEDARVIEMVATLGKSGLAGDIYLLSESPPTEEQMRALSWAGSRICVQSNLHLKPETIASLIRQSPYQLLLLPRSCLAQIPAETLDAALDKAAGQVLVIN